VKSNFTKKENEGDHSEQLKAFSQLVAKLKEKPSTSK
jgi:hypothetical protein